MSDVRAGKQREIPDDTDPGGYGVDRPASGKAGQRESLWEPDCKSGDRSPTLQMSNSDEFEEYWIGKNGMACEDLQAADLNGDGKPELIASGRATKNLKIYWNRN